MLDTTKTPRSILRQYADALMANAAATTEDEKYQIADDLIECVGDIEEQGEQVAQFIYDLLEHSDETMAV